jgi:hypothetical protein
LEELGRWRSLPPEEVGLVVEGDSPDQAFVSTWLVEVTGKSGDRRVVLQTIAVKADGTRVPAMERNQAQYFSAPATDSQLSPGQRLSIFEKNVEAALQRELKHKGAASGDGSYSAELIGFVEVCDKGANHHHP